ncbi:hypothetical protein PC116_g16533 [Phytophthora cactorum]|nr:hypothetical protein PC128_g19312 [Phytophthora cactorum]KAG4235332.1 hypothetical protein PC116_g16533 [Phytophthora cactorum]
MAVINALIASNARHAVNGKNKLSHGHSLKKLHLHLCQLRLQDWAQLLRRDGLEATPGSVQQAIAAHHKSDEEGHTRVARASTGFEQRGAQAL